METSSSTNDEFIARSLVVPAPETEHLRVGSLPLLERWHKALALEKIDCEEVTMEELRSRLAVATGPVILAAGGWAIEQLAVEKIAETVAECGAMDLLLPAADGLPAAPVVCLGQDTAKLAAGLTDWTLAHGSEALLASLRGAGGVRIRELPMDVSYWSRVSDRTSADAATWGLLKRLQFRPGGLVAKYLNRPISIRFSRLLINTRITPNMTTAAAFVVGVVGVVLLLLGGYWWAVAGTFLLHVNSVWDGIDGELAQMRYQMSQFGAYLDSVCDEILNAAILVAAGWHLSRNGYWDGYLYLGIYSGVMSFTYALVHWHCKWKHGLGFYWWFEAYKPRKQVQRSTSPLAYLKKLFCKDSILLIFFIAAVFQFMHWVIWVAVAGATTAVVLFVIHIPIKRARW